VVTHAKVQRFLFKNLSLTTSPSPSKVDKALSAARAAGVSAALFALGWVFENSGEAGADFEHAQEKFWGLVQDSWPATRAVVRALPFESDFNQVRDEIFRFIFLSDFMLVVVWVNLGPTSSHLERSSRGGHGRAGQLHKR
jgi:hypothetical protein